MKDLRFEQNQSLQMRQEMGQVLRMEQADLLEMTDADFQRMVADTEHGRMFQRLYRKEGLVHYHRFPRTDIAPAFFQPGKEVAATGSLDVESLLQNREEVVGLVRKLGLEKFKRCFLFPEPGRTENEIAADCGLKAAEVGRINLLIDDFSIMSEFYHPSGVTGGIRYTRVAAVKRDGNGFVIGYYSAGFARGSYSIDYARFEELKAAGGFTEAEAKEAKQLFKKLELINSRKDTVTRVLQGVVEKQALYLDNGEVKSLLPFSQKELAARLGMAPSSISRAIRGKSLETPSGAEVPLKDFFPNPRRFRQELVKQILSNGDLSSDEAVRARLWQKFGVAISRRSVASLRQRLKVPAMRGKSAAPEATR